MAMFSREAASRRSVLKTTGIGLSAGLAGCLSDLGGSDSVQLTLAATGGSWGEARTNAFIDPYRNEEEPWGEHDVELSQNTMPYSTRVPRLEANIDDPPWELIELDQPASARFGEQGAVLPAEEHIPNWENLVEGFRTRWQGGMVVTLSGLGYNTDLVDKEITSFEDLLDPAFEGNVGFPSWDWTGHEYFYLWNQMRDGSLDDKEPGFNFVREFLDNDPVIIQDMDHGIQLMKNEEIVISPFPSGRTDSVEVETDGQVSTEFVVPEEGALSTTWDIAMLDNTMDDAQMEATINLINGTYTPEAQAEFAKEIGYPPTHPDAYDHIPESAYEERPSLRLSPEDFENINKVDIDWLEVEQHKAEDAEEWRKIVRG